MALARVQSASGINDNASGTSVASSALATTTGNCILVAALVRFNGANLISGVTDTAGNSYSQLEAINGNGIDLEVWIATNITANAANVVTASHTGQAQRSLVIVEEWSGVVTSSPLDQKNEGADNSTPLQTASITTANANDLIWTAWGVGANTITYSLATGFTNLTTTQGSTSEIATASKVVSSTGTYTGDMGTDGASTHEGIVVSIKAALSVGRSAQRMMLGIG